MRKYLILLGLAGVCMAGAEDICLYKDMPDGSRQQTCYDLSKPKDAQKYDDLKKSLIPRAGIFDGALPTRVMQTNQALSLPDVLTPMAFDSLLSDVIFSGVFDGVKNEFILDGITLIKGQELAAKELILNLFPKNSVGYLEWTGNYRNYKKEANLWLGSSLVSVVLVERGLAQPLEKAGKYSKELEIAAEFARNNKLGAFAAPKP